VMVKVDEFGNWGEGFRYLTQACQDTKRKYQVVGKGIVALLAVLFESGDGFRRLYSGLGGYLIKVKGEGE
jgi:hypothetical protein